MNLFLDYALSTDLYRELCRASAAGQIVRLRNPQNDRTTWSYDDAGRTTVQRLANGARASYSYDDADQVLRLANIKSDGTTLSSFDYKYDPAGNRSRVVEANGDRVTWSYDNTYQLTREQRSGANSYHLTYSYDVAGNRLSKRDAGTPTTYSYDAANQLQTEKTPSGTTTYTFDNNGNQSRKVEPGGGRTTWSWDYEDRLTSVRLPSGVRNTMAYDADGRRVEKQDSSGTTKHIWDLENILLETDQGNVTQAVYTLEPLTYGNLISQVRGGTSAFALFDALGSTDRLTNSAGTVTDSYLYQAFGVIQASSGSTVNPFRYVGRQGYYYDTDLASYDLRARYYLSDLGRFLSADPLLLKAAGPGSEESFLDLMGMFSDFHAGFGPVTPNWAAYFVPKRYTYVENNPPNAVDPHGLLTQFASTNSLSVLPIAVEYLLGYEYELTKAGDKGRKDIPIPGIRGQCFRMACQASLDCELSLSNWWSCIWDKPDLNVSRMIEAARRACNAQKRAQHQYWNFDVRPHGCAKDECCSFDRKKDRTWNIKGIQKTWTVKGKRCTYMYRLLVKGKCLTQIGLCVKIPRILQLFRP